MRMKRTLKVTVEMYSEVSEADLYDHIEYFVMDIKNTIHEKGGQSWNRTINTSWDDSHEVTIGINVEDIVQDNIVKDLQILVRHMDLCCDRADVYRSILQKGVQKDADRLIKLLDGDS